MTNEELLAKLKQQIAANIEEIRSAFRAEREEREAFLKRLAESGALADRKGRLQ